MPRKRFRFSSGERLSFGAHTDRHTQSRQSMTRESVVRIQEALTALDLDGWLLCSFRDSNPISAATLGLTTSAHVTRRWACCIPRTGQPRGLVHTIEPHIGGEMPGEVRSYSSFDQFSNGLRWLVDGLPSVAMEYSPENSIPVVSRVDAGTIELVRSLGTQVVSSADLVSWLGARLDDAQIASTRRAGALVRDIMMLAFRFVRDAIASTGKVSEYEVQAMIMEEFERRGMVTDHAPIVAVGAHSADPHYAPTLERHSSISEGNFLLIDLWGREAGTQSVFGDITWTGYVGDTVPEEHAGVFAVVAAARDAAYDLVAQRFQQGDPVVGAEVDRAARAVIDAAGFGEYFVHRTGHSITWELHGAGANIDGFETNDTRRLVPGTSFSIEPGIYLPGRFGIRSEIDVLIDHDGSVEATSEPRQTEIIPILGV